MALRARKVSGAIEKQAPEVGSRKSELRSRQSELRSLQSELRSRKLEVGTQKSEVGTQKSEVLSPPFAFIVSQTKHFGPIFFLNNLV